MQQQENKSNTKTKGRNPRKILFQNIANITQKFDVKYTHIIQSPYNIQ